MKRAGTACRKIGCAGIVRAGVCSACGPQRQRSDHRYDEQRGSSASRGYDARWRRLRLMFLHAHPLCAECAGQGRTVAASEAHHQVAKRDGGSDAFSNLVALCKPCHSRITAAGG
jgi:5-methylcytosine-specific restriction protein A